MITEADTILDVTLRPAVNFGERDAVLPVDILLLHYTGMKSSEAAIDWLCVEESGVSCHYVVNESGAITQLVSEKMRAWHAGMSSWQGQTDINSRSIGIEIVNPGHEHGYPAFPKQQIEAVCALSKDIVTRHDIPARNVLAHSDVAPARKRDPGEKFPWRTLAEAGVGLWLPEDANTDPIMCQGENSESVAGIKSWLVAYGYDLEINGEFDEELALVVRAFQRHFRPSTVSGVLDIGTCNTIESLLKIVAEV